MSTLKVEVSKIDQIVFHPNADRLEIAVVKGWQTVVGKGQFKAGDAAIYIPIDSILPEKLEAYLFPPESKIKLEKSRVRTIKIRQAISQGMLVEISPELEKLYPGISKFGVDTDVAGILGITKFEPPEHSVPGHMKSKNTAKINHPLFVKYTDIENFKFYNNLFKEDETVYITEKVHGTSVRYAILPTYVGNNVWKKIKKWLHLLPEFEFCYGSRNVQLQIKKNLYYKEDVYAIIAKQLGLEHILKPGEQLFGEIVGDGIQKGYAYGCKQGEWKFFAYDVKDERGYLNAEQFKKWCDERGVARVPELLFGPFKKDELDKYRTGPSAIDPTVAKEGSVIKPQFETITYMGRKVLKHINDAYLLEKENTDFH